jgi:hypothetical protein
MQGKANAQIDMQGKANAHIYIMKIRYAAKMTCRQGSANLVVMMGCYDLQCTWSDARMHVVALLYTPSMMSW